MRIRSLGFLLNAKFKFLRKIYYFYNVYIRNLKFLKKSSQWDEDKFLKKYFKNYRKGKYLDIGCFHPVRDNNTYQLYKKKWNGINIDLNPLTIELFNFSRSRDINLNIALSRKQLDITNISQLEKIIDVYKPSIIINTAAFTNVDSAEDNPDEAFEVNAIGPKTLLIFVIVNLYFSYIFQLIMYLMA